MSTVVNAYKNLNQEEAELQKKLLEVRQKKELQAKELRAIQVSILGQAVLKGIESGQLETSFLETLVLSKKERRFFDEMGSSGPKGWNKIE